ncbi:MAG: ABC transporter ATP-binding protein [Alphaproteobacteria bacterium]|nr:ABC transporter ATP-binding protein [Alphaproteobacteria bacterium]MBQ6110509.1 ABC transporter ATP-binding protein [Alphaproteobacteria bacterium]
MKQDTFPKTLRGFYWLVIKKFPFYFGIIFLCGVIGNAINLIFDPLIMKWMTQVFENAISANYHTIFKLICFLIGVWCSTTILQLITSIFNGRRMQIFNRYKLYLLYKRIYANDISFFIDHPAGQIESQRTEISGQLFFLMQSFWTEIIGTVLGFLFIVGSLFMMNIWFVIILLTYGIIKVVWEWIIQRRIKANKIEEMEESSIYSGIRSDSLNNALVVKYFANTEYENMYIYRGRERLIEIIRQAYYLERLQGLPTRILWIFTRVLLLVLCFVLIKDGELSISNAVFVMTSAMSINGSFSKINNSLRKYSTNSARATKAYNNLVVPIKIQDKENAKNLRVKKATVDFNDVSFAYGKNKVFHNFNLHIDNAEKVGIVGLSGAGKTTLCNLLLRMYDVQTGAIKIDGTDIRDIKQDSLLRNISFVPQETTLFNRTIFENIKYAKPTATKAEIINAAKKAHIHEFISKLPKGYDTLVGNNGIRLSGGQRQRVSIARALLKNAAILVLDEATSALDSQNEQMIQKSLSNAMKGKTTLVIAHRLSTLKNMDRIIVIKNGKIVETGSHNQLLHKGGEYSKLWRIQTHKK